MPTRLLTCSQVGHALPAARRLSSLPSIRSTSNGTRSVYTSQAFGMVRPAPCAWPFPAQRLIAPSAPYLLQQPLPMQARLVASMAPPPKRPHVVTSYEPVGTLAPDKRRELLQALRALNSTIVTTAKGTWAETHDLSQLPDDAGVFTVCNRYGSLQGYLTRRASGYVGLLAVHPSSRRNGLASELVRAAVPAGPIWLDVRESNVPALHMYRQMTRQGLVVCEERRGSYVNGDARARFRLSLRHPQRP